MNDDLLRTSILSSGKIILGLFAVNDTYHNIEYLTEGEENYIYKISGERALYVARILKPGNTRAEVDYRFEFEFQDYLRTHDVPAPRQYLTTTNTFYATHKLGGATLQITLHDFVDGNVVTKPSPRQVKAVAELLGKMHSLAHNFTPPYDRLEHLDAFAWLDDTMQTPRSGMLAEKAFALYAQYGDVIKSNLVKLNRLPLHNDIHFGNLLFKTDQLVAVLDFDESHMHYISLELGWSTGQICNLGDFASFKKNLAVFQKYYLAQYQLTELERVVSTSALIAETSRKFLKQPNDPVVAKKFKNILETLDMGILQPAGR
jgi:Ser/Thr protein kinase RdoA (MazF antagonist)